MEPVEPASAFQLAQLNIGLPRGPVGSEVLREFVEALDSVNAVADAAPGFVWRLQTEEGNATALHAFGDERLILNMSVWESLAALRAFVYADPAHKAVLRRRREWFTAFGEPFLVLWWVPAGHRPAIAEAEERLTTLRTEGPTPHVFTFRVSFPPPDLTGDATLAAVDERTLCPA